MVTNFTNCDSCYYKSNCTMKTEVNELLIDICDAADKKKKSEIVNSKISIIFKCNKYKTDYGKGAGL